MPSRPYKEWGSQSGSSHLQGFFRLVYTNLKSFRTSCDIQASLLSLFWETDLPLYAWGPAYYRDRSLTETHSKPSVSLLSFYRNRDSLNAPEPSSRMNTTPKFFTESRGTDNSRLNKLSQMVTYLGCDELKYGFKKCLWAELDKQQKMLLSLRSNPQTMNPYIQKSDGLCTRTDHHMLLPIVLHIVVPLYLKEW